MFRLPLCLCVLVLSVYCYGCKQQDAYYKNSTHKDVPDESIKSGALLARQYCQSCHLLPAPGLLTAPIWENDVLPHMGPHLGIFEYKYKKYPNSLNDVNAGKGYYPAKPLLSLQQWQNIIDYYTAVAPDSLHGTNNESHLKDGTHFFKAVIPPDLHYSPATCFIKADSTTQTIVTSDILLKMSYRFNRNLRVVDSFFSNDIITDMLFDKNNIAACNIGLFSPNNAKAGSIEQLNNSSHKKQATIIDTLVRPVSLAAADFNSDGKTDYVTCEFGYLRGALAWHENKGNGAFIKHIIKAVPGAIKVYVKDDNHDGLPDIYALFAQGDEGISLFTNMGGGRFTEKRVLRFPPSYGSSSFQLVDMNKDGYDDIIYTCGDNADFSAILKPYHGVYIFINDGQNNFKQQYFYHINGCYKAIANDFDGDGNIDIATIAYFADYNNNPNEGFVFLHNTGGFNFTPYTIPATNTGRWITMDAADVDGDGKTDLLLASCSVGPTLSKSRYDWKNGPPFMLLKNICQ